MRYIPQSLPIPIVVWGGNQSRKNAFPESSLPTAYLPKAMLLFSLLLPAVKLLLEIPSCSALPLILHTRWCSALILRQWPTCAQCRCDGCNKCPTASAARAFFFTSFPSLFFFFSFFIFLFPLGIGKCTMLCNTKDEVASWLWKRCEVWLMPFFIMMFWGMPLFHEPVCVISLKACLSRL